ncbi:MAG: glycosyltransferase family 4 protein [Prevotellaceae bacterium]|jgi:glycosyltransferase involved in cell wall biosynthesis|nr:glycosyltransferase family 4 protein [Prevotellaceae bacterium]
MQKYIVITPFFPTQDSFRGPFIYDMVKAIQRTGKFDEVIVFRPSNVDSEYEYGGVRVFLFKAKYLPSNIFPGLFDKFNKKSFLKRLSVLNISLSDVVVAHGHVSSQALFVNAIKEKNPCVKTIIQYHERDPFLIRLGLLKSQLWHRKIVARHNIALCSQVDLHVGVAEGVIENALSFPSYKKGETYDEYINLVKGMEKVSALQAKDTYVLYNGVDVNTFYPLRKETKSEIFQIGCIANFIDLKNQITLIKAVELLINNGNKDIRVRFVGSGVTMQYCIDYINEHFLQEYFLFEKEVFHSELNKFYNSLDLFVLPSYFEGFGCVYTEAYACGVPFIAVKGQGIAEMIREEDKDKWLIAKGDYKQLGKLINDYKEKHYKQILQKTYSIDNLVRNYLCYLLNEIDK